jgi:hypothetical protein
MNSTLLLNDAEVAVAAYADLQFGDTSVGTNQQALINAGMSSTQATEFAKRYPKVVLPTYDDRASDFQARRIKGPGSTYLGMGHKESLLLGRRDLELQSRNNASHFFFRR